MHVSPAPLTAFTSYHKKLFVFLSVATFFEGYDFLALTQILPNIRKEWGLSEWQGGLLVTVINVGTVLAYLLVRKADRWGRRRVLMLTIFGYTLFTFLTGFATNVYFFAIFQLLARLFLIGEWAISMVYAAEEFPADRRGMVIGIIQGSAAIGAILCAAFVPLLVQTPWGWRSVYFVGILPLLLLAFARRGLKETERFQAQAADTQTKAQPFAFIFSTLYQKRVLFMALIWALAYTCTMNSVTFFKEFALADRKWTESDVGVAVTIASLASIPMVFFSGKLLDLIGRKNGAAIIFSLSAFGVFGAYTFQSFGAITFCLIFVICAASSTLPVLNSYNTELFPTNLRADAFAWSNNLLGRAFGFVLSPLLIGSLATSFGWGPPLAATSFFLLGALALILAFLPETKGLDLEETSKVPALH